MEWLMVNWRCWSWCKYPLFSLAKCIWMDIWLCYRMTYQLSMYCIIYQMSTIDQCLHNHHHLCSEKGHVSLTANSFSMCRYRIYPLSEDCTIPEVSTRADQQVIKSINWLNHSTFQASYLVPSHALLINSMLYSTVFNVAHSKTQMPTWMSYHYFNDSAAWLVSITCLSICHALE